MLGEVLLCSLSFFWLIVIEQVLVAECVLTLPPSLISDFLGLFSM